MGIASASNSASGHNFKLVDGSGAHRAMWGGQPAAAPILVHRSRCQHGQRDTWGIDEFKFKQSDKAYHKILGTACYKYHKIPGTACHKVLETR